MLVYTPESILFTFPFCLCSMQPFHCTSPQCKSQGMAKLGEARAGKAGGAIPAVLSPLPIDCPQEYLIARYTLKKKKRMKKKKKSFRRRLQSSGAVFSVDRNTLCLTGRRNTLCSPSAQCVEVFLHTVTHKNTASNFALYGTCEFHSSPCHPVSCPPPPLFPLPGLAYCQVTPANSKKPLCL